MTLDWSRVIGLTGAFLIYLLALLAPLLATHHPFEITLIEHPQPPSKDHLFGTDQLGRDIFSRSIYALRHSLIISTLASVSIITLGSGFGVVSGYFGGILDWGLVGLIDCMLAFPTLLLTIGVCATLGPGTTTILISLIFTGWASIARMIRSSV